MIDKGGRSRRGMLGNVATDRYIPTRDVRWPSVRLTTLRPTGDKWNFFESSSAEEAQR